MRKRCWHCTESFFFMVLADSLVSSPYYSSLSLADPSMSSSYYSFLSVILFSMCFQISIYFFALLVPDKHFLVMLLTSFISVCSYSALHNCSVQTTVTFNIAKVLQFLRNGAVYQQIVNEVQIL